MRFVCHAKVASMTSTNKQFCTGSAVLVAFVGLLVVCGCARESPAFTLDVEMLAKLGPETTAGITYEEKGDELFVLVTDRYGDGHTHRLVLGNATRAQALELLRKKQIELQRK